MSQLTLFDLKYPPRPKVAYAAPMVFHPGGWADTLPDWIREEVLVQRAIKATNDDGLATDVEAAAYLYTASLVAPFDSDWADIYIYLVTQLMPDKMPDDLRRDSINTYQEGLLHDLKRRIREKQKKLIKGERKCKNGNAGSNETTGVTGSRQVNLDH